MCLQSLVHFSYLGDATLSANVNVGASTITCNYDDEREHPAVVEDDVFIGDTMLVAAVKMGKEGPRQRLAPS
jgi:bifunctional UDP-N-acetylglucosamine pyrophosphorylase/glucosamine-1-phosphate N-acetyltransferase